MNKFSSMFGQVLQIFSKREFYQAVKETKAEKGAKRLHLLEPVPILSLHGMGLKLKNKDLTPMAVIADPDPDSHSTAYYAASEASPLALRCQT